VNQKYASLCRFGRRQQKGKVLFPADPVPTAPFHLFLNRHEIFVPGIKKPPGVRGF
jgi:hypothetical protein